MATWIKSSFRTLEHLENTSFPWIIVNITGHCEKPSNRRPKSEASMNWKKHPTTVQLLILQLLKNIGILSYPTCDFRYMKNTSARRSTVLSFTTWLTAWQQRHMSYASLWHLPIPWRIHGSDWLPFTHMNGWFWWNQVGTAHKCHTLILWE